MNYSVFQKNSTVDCFWLYTFWQASADRSDCLIFLCKNAIFLEYPVIDLINALTYFFLAVAGHAVEIQAGQQQSMVPTNKSIQIETVAKHVYNLQVKKDWNYCKAWSQLTDQNTLKLL